MNVRGNAQSIHIKGLNITADLVEDFSFASTGTVSVSTIDANSTPISGSMIKFTGGANTGTVNAEGLSYARTIAPIGGGGGSCTTDSTGACVFPAVFPLDDQLNFSALIPGGLTLTGSGNAGSGGNTVVIQALNYAQLLSQGTSSGSVGVSSPTGTAISGLAITPVSSGLPVGSVILAGSISYTLSDLTPGAEEDVVIELPPGSGATNVYKFIDGAFVDVSSIATITGDTITMHLTDGGTGDEDGVANGVIVDPVVPVKLVQQPQTITFTPPGTATVGASAALVATSTSGLPVTFSVDATSGAGVCTLSNATTVHYLAAGTCLIDALAAGNVSYLPATPVQGSILVQPLVGTRLQLIAFLPIGQRTLAQSPVPVLALATSGLSVTLTSSTSAVCTVSGKAVTLRAVGTCTIVASQSGNATYKAAPSVTRSFSVTQAVQSIVFAMINDRTLAQPAFTPTVWATFEPGGRPQLQDPDDLLGHRDDREAARSRSVHIDGNPIRQCRLCGGEPRDAVILGDQGTPEHRLRADRQPAPGPVAVLGDGHGDVGSRSHADLVHHVGLHRQRHVHHLAQDRHLHDSGHPGGQRDLRGGAVGDPYLQSQLSSPFANPIRVASGASTVVPPQPGASRQRGD